MKQPIKDQWTAALRSGQYQQGTSALVSQNLYDPTDVRHCCLGVLCELAFQAGVVARRLGSDGYAFGTEGDYDSWNSTYLPPVVMEWAGLLDVDDGIGDIHVRTDEDDLTTLSWLNDNHSSFADIAGLIEDQL